MGMKQRYTVNVHYDAVVTVDVIANSEEEAVQKALYKAEDISLEDAEVFDINCCVTNIEDLYP